MKPNLSFLVSLGIYNWSNIRALMFLYTDPGSGALLWQLLVAGFIGALFYARLFFRRAIAMIFCKRRGRQDDQPAAVDQAAPTTPNQDGLP
jgi:hypothetical protein